MTNIIVAFRYFANVPRKFGSIPESPLHLQGKISYGNIAVYSDKTRNVTAVWPNSRFLMSMPAVNTHIGLVRVDVG